MGRLCAPGIHDFDPAALEVGDIPRGETRARGARDSGDLRVEYRDRLAASPALGGYPSEWRAAFSRRKQTARRLVEERGSASLAIARFPFASRTPKDIRA